MIRRPNLVVIRAGDRPYCRSWGQLSDHPRSWDCYINYYGQGACAPDIGQEMTFRHGITKFIGIAELCDASPDAFDGYDALLVLDDDIEITPPQINEFFDVFHGHGLMLAQPSLHRDSFFNHVVTVHDRRCILRFTRFVEIMMPAFSRAAFALCRPTFRASVSGWGVDCLWAQRLSFPERAVAIVDAVVARHLKPSDLQDGEFYRMLRGHGVDPRAELDEIVRRYDIDVPALHHVRGRVWKSKIWRRALQRLALVGWE